VILFLPTKETCQNCGDGSRNVKVHDVELMESGDAGVRESKKGGEKRDSGLKDFILPPISAARVFEYFLQQKNKREAGDDGQPPSGSSVANQGRRIKRRDLHPR